MLHVTIRRHVHKQQHVIITPRVPTPRPCAVSRVANYYCLHKQKPFDTYPPSQHVMYRGSKGSNGVAAGEVAPGFYYY